MPGTGMRGGIALDFSRRETSKKLLAIEWDFPASLDLKPQEGPTQSSARMSALERSAAFARLTEKDSRPLLILRECGHCRGTEDALLSRKLDNERTQLLAQFFHCVKFKSNVLEENHTFHRVFGSEQPPHLMLTNADGSQTLGFDGAQSQSDLWKGMTKFLAASYELDADRAVKELVKLMGRYDQLDAEQVSLREQLEKEIEASGPKTARARKLAARLERLERERKEMTEREAKLLDLKLKMADL